MLDNGSQFPRIDAKGLEGGSVTIGELAEGSWTAVLLYRGHW